MQFQEKEFAQNGYPIYLFILNYTKYLPPIPNINHKTNNTLRTMLEKMRDSFYPEQIQSQHTKMSVISLKYIFKYTQCQQQQQKIDIKQSIILYLQGKLQNWPQFNELHYHQAQVQYQNEDNTTIFQISRYEQIQVLLHQFMQITKLGLFPSRNRYLILADQLKQNTDIYLAQQMITLLTDDLKSLKAVYIINDRLKQFNNLDEILKNIHDSQQNLLSLEPLANCVSNAKQFLQKKPKFYDTIDINFCLILYKDENQLDVLSSLCRIGQCIDNCINRVQEQIQLVNICNNTNRVGQCFRMSKTLRQIIQENDEILCSNNSQFVKLIVYIYRLYSLKYNDLSEKLGCYEKALYQMAQEQQEQVNQKLKLEQHNNIHNFYMSITNKINDSTLTRDMAMGALEITDNLLRMLKPSMEESFLQRINQLERLKYNLQLCLQHL